MTPPDYLVHTYDPALQLRVRFDRGEKISHKEAIILLDSSVLVNRLTSELIEQPLYYIWRIIALSEIPYAQYLRYTQNLIDRIYEKLIVPFGFSLSGDERMFLPCYNAMLVSALCRLGRANDKEVRNAVEWINKYQPMERGLEINVPGLRFDRYGGCFRQIPCYINVVKSTRALLEYEKASAIFDFTKKKEQGIRYILQHQLYKRLSNGEPITRNILRIAFPESYQLNIVELITLMEKAGQLNNKRIEDAVSYLNMKKNGKGWKVNYRYKSAGYIVFDQGKGNGDWVSYILNNALSKFHV